MGSARRVLVAGAVAALTLGPVVATAAPRLAATSPPASDAAFANQGCDPIDPRLCYLPFPNNHFTVPDDSTPTGRRVALPPDGAPVNADGVPIDVSEWNRNDGFSPSSTILAYVADLDPSASLLPSWVDLEGSLDLDAPVVLIDSGTGERVELWAELDSHAADAPDDQLLVIHPAEVLREGHTYAVALRDLVGTDGTTIEAGAAFAAIRDGVADAGAAVQARAAELEPVLTALADAGIERDSLFLAWDFTVASTDDITGRMVHIRDHTLAELGDSAPPFSIDSVVDAPTDDEGEPRTGLARTVTGSFTVTNWLTGDGGPGQRFNVVDPGPDALPTANGTVTAPFQCNIPDSAMDADDPAHLIQYGHGLLGSADEIDAANQIRLANLGNAVICATDWAGMSELDVANAAATLAEFSNFPTMADRLQQGMVDQLVLTRLMSAADGLVSDPAFQQADGTPLIDDGLVVFNGNSQGAIIGLALAAVSTDIDRFVLGVAGMDFGLLLPRSSDYTTYEQILDPAYPDPADRALILAMTQMLWDRGEGAGYVNHVTADPLPGTAAKTVLVHVAFGDWQVSELSAYIEARALGVPIHTPVTAEGRSPSLDPTWGLAAIEYPSAGSGLVVWDSGSDPIPIGNQPPSTSRDPHEDPRADPDVQQQIVTFLFDDQLVDVCSAAPCTADPVD